jgi:XRE family transcriptional regulator, regulator of sulfur utilization
MEPSARSLLAANVKKLRQQHGWSQEDLAYNVGLSNNYIAAVERGEQDVTIIRMEKLALVLKVPVVRLLEA